MFDKEDIKYHAVNSVIAGGLVFFGAFVGAREIVTWNGFLASLAAASLVALTKFKEYWSNENQVKKKRKKKKQNKIFSFV